MTFQLFKHLQLLMVNFLYQLPSEMTCIKTRKCCKMVIFVNHYSLYLQEIGIKFFLAYW